MADKLTPQQHQAVYNRGGKLLVSAAAGSGKTKVLVDRLLSYLTDPSDPANLDEFLIITYTKAAAAELRGKIAAKLTERIALDPENRHLQKQMQRLYLTKISTVHGFCSDILREYAYKLDLPADFRVADENECREIREQVLTDLLDRSYAHLGSDADFLAFVDTQGLGRNDRLIPEILEKVYDSARCHLDPEAWLQKCLELSVPEDLVNISETPWGKYLTEDLQTFLETQIQILKQCLHRLNNEEGMEKAAANLQATTTQLEVLLSAQSWDEIVASAHVDFGRLTFPKKNVDVDLIERVKSARNTCKKELEQKLRSFSDNAARILLDLQQSAASIRGLIALVQQFEQDYQRVKRSRKVLDFSDLEQKTLDLLLGKKRSGPTVTAIEISRRFREILVDEYQDSNGVQDAIFDALTGERQNCFLVGDVKQSIYQFRLADPNIFLTKYHAYQSPDTADLAQGRKVLLSHNFRSGPEIVSAVNDVFRTCMSRTVGGLDYGDMEALREGIPQDPLPDSAVELHCLITSADAYEEEAAFVAGRIRRMLDEGTLIRKNGELKPVQPQDIVILLRSPGSAAAYFQKAMEQQGIRCTTGAGTDLLLTEEVGTIRSLLETIQNPRQDIPLISTLASPVFCFTADELAEIRSVQKKGSIYEALLLSHLPKTKSFLQILSSLRAEARMRSVSSLLDQCLGLTKLDSIYAAMPDGDIRLANIQTFHKIAVDFENGTLKDLQQFLDYLTCMEQRGLVSSGNAVSDAVTIMSIHKSKGLEFPVVFLSNLSRRFNQESLRAQILCDKELGLGLSVADTHNRLRYPSAARRAIAVKMQSESISEEMRVLYVALTRARDRLIMTYASKSLPSDYQDIVLLQDFDGGKQVCRNATCMGEWVLLAASRRMEAGQLHALGGRPSQICLGDFPWKITVSESEPQEMHPNCADVSFSSKPQINREEFLQSLRYEYPHAAATAAVSKQTATDLKGRIKDTEAAENTPVPTYMSRTWKKPSFLSGRTEGKEFGNLIHTIMQYIRYEACKDESSIHKELKLLEEKGFLTPEQTAMAEPEKLMGFFSSEIARKIQSGTPYLREFKFSILVDADKYDAALSGEQVLLQGVVDCALLEPDGITVVDFKTDHVTEQTLSAATERYRMQVQIYSEALEKIYELPIKARYLYFYRLNRFIKL